MRVKLIFPGKKDENATYFTIDRIERIIIRILIGLYTI